MNPETQKLSQLLTQETLLATKLLELMQQEQNVLEQGLLEPLKTITIDKADCLDQIEAISRKRVQLLFSLSKAPSTVERMKDYIANQPQPINESLTLAVENLELALDKCRHQNSVNGMVISMSQRNVQRNLNILKGTDSESMTYTQKGQTTSIGKVYGGLKV